jgi:hypothetical protein
VIEVMSRSEILVGFGLFIGGLCFLCVQYEVRD